MVHNFIDLLNYCGLTNPIACTFAELRVETTRSKINDQHI
jgi:hypothetical protein